MKRIALSVRIASAAAIIAALAGCASVPGPACNSHEQLSVVDALYFGTAKQNGTVSADEWNAFLKNTVTPRFPDGLTAWQASGQWKSGSGAIVRESSYVLNLVHPDDAAGDSAVREIVETYKKEFAQEAVLRVRSTACTSL
jgi:hypothetical protein